jgi:hypothetical protein
MITGYKRQKLGHPSLMMSPSSVASRIMAGNDIAIFVVAYMFVKSFPDPTTGNYPPSPLIRIAVISLVPIVCAAGHTRCYQCRNGHDLRLPCSTSMLGMGMGEEIDQQHVVLCCASVCLGRVCISIFYT